MTTRRPLLLVALLFAIGAFVVALRGRALASAQGDVSRERAALDRTAADLRELADLKGQREVVAAAKRPTQDVIAQVNAVLRDAGVPTERMQGLEPEADAPLAGRYRTQTIRVSLDRLALREVGAFLAAWRAAKTVWTPRSLELTHVAAADGADQGFAARVLIGATYLSDAPQESSR